METILTRLQESFAAWQALSPSSIKRHSNAALRKEAIKCLEHYSYREVSKAIGMSVETLRSWQKSLRYRDQAMTDDSSGFIAMNLYPAKDTDETSHALSLKISLPGGLVIQVESKNPQSSAAFIIALNKESSRCSI